MTPENARTALIAALLLLGSALTLWAIWEAR